LRYLVITDQNKAWEVGLLDGSSSVNSTSTWSHQWKPIWPISWTHL